ncbi:MAG: YitT family protein [Desulfovibrionaceae bacterium]
MGRPSRFRNLTFSVPWNMGVITLGCLLIAFAVKAVAIPHGFIAGGMSGLGLVTYYGLGGLTPGQWYFALNVPVFLVGWVFVSRRFFLYSLYGMFAVSAFIDLLSYRLPVEDPWLAVLAGGAILGAGVGVALRSLGSTGGVDILMVLFHQKWGLRMGWFEFLFNLLVFLGGALFLDLSRILYSMALIAVTSIVMEQVLSLGNERKAALVISDKPKEVARAIMDGLDKGTTYLPGVGGYTDQPRTVVYSVVHSHQLKRLEEIVYTVDPSAFTVILSTLNAFGEGFSARKVY